MARSSNATFDAQSEAQSQWSPPRSAAEFEPMPTKLWTPDQTLHVTENYMRAFRSTPNETRQKAYRFYPGWHDTAEHLGAAMGGNAEHGAALLAHLSPQTESEINRVQALQVVHGVTDKQTATMLQAGVHGALAKSASASIESSKRRGETPDPTKVAAYEHHSGENARLRGESGLSGTPLFSHPSTRIAAALRVRQGDYGDDPFSSLSEVKIRDFAGAIAHPDYGRAPIDVHFHDVGMGLLDLPHEAQRGLSSKGRYEGFQNAAQIAHKRGMARRSGVSVPDWMSAIWYGQRSDRAEYQPEAAKARKTAETLLAGEGARPYLPERFGLTPRLV